jgi:uncharacterized caspase-like protein
MKKLFVVLFVFAAAGVFAQQKFALVIGNGNYTNTTKLNNPVNDANDMAAALQGLGFTVDKVLNGTQDQMVNAIMQLKRRLSASRNSYGFLFYAGHGIQSGGENFLIPVDANIPSENFLRNRSVSVQEMLDELNDAENEFNVVVLDACRNNPFSWARSGSRGLTVVGSQPADSIIVFATAAGSTASDGTGRNGLFTQHLLNNLKTPGLEVTEVFRKTGADVSRASNNEQRPAVYNQFYGTAYLGARPSAATSQPAPAPAVQPAPTPAPAVTPAAPPVNPPTVRPARTQTGNATQEMQTRGYSAAHNSLPIGSKALIRSLSSGRDVVVTITEQIPTSTRRIIDVSPTAALAIELGFGGPVIVTPLLSYEATPDGFGFEIVNGRSVTITVYIENAATVNIPAQIQGLPVTAIGDSVFRSRSYITSVTIPDGVTSIGSSAFSYCSNITSITIPTSVTSIGNEAFKNCRSLTSITLSRRTQVGKDAFPSETRISYRD